MRTLDIQELAVIAGGVESTEKVTLSEAVRAGAIVGGVYGVMLGVPAAVGHCLLYALSGRFNSCNRNYSLAMPSYFSLIGAALGAVLVPASLYADSKIQ